MAAGTTTKFTKKPSRFSELIAKKEFAGFIIAFIGAFLLFPYFFEIHIYPIGATPPSSVVTDINRVYPWYSLDPSWTVAFNKFNIDNLVWGKDVSFTYGPLAYLSTRVGWGINKYNLLLFDLFVWFNFFCIFYSAWVKSENKKIAALLIAATCFFLPSAFASGIALVLLAFVIFWIRQSLEEPKPFYYVMQIALIVLVFFIKFNTSLISFFLFIVALIYKAFFTKDKKWPLLVYLAVPVIFIILFSKILHVTPIEYLKGGLNMVSGYNEIMYLTMPVVIEYKYTFAILVLSAFILLWKMYLEKMKGLYKNLVVFALFSTSIYVVYKQAFVRNDIQHILDFNKFCLIFIIAIQDFYYKQTGKFSHWIIVAIVFISFLFSKRRDDHLFKFNEKVVKRGYIKGFANFSDSSGMHLFPNNNQMPDSIHQLIGKSTVDIYPWNIHLLFENKLNYKPRPVFQAYTAYTPYLEKLNFDFYNSDQAPEYIIYDYDGIDNRYPLFDEPKLNLLLLKNYEFKTFFDFIGRPNLVLKRKKEAKKITFTKVKEFEITSDDFIEPKPNSYYELFVTSTLKGTISSLLSHSPEIFLVVKTKDGSQREFKTSKKLLESGLFSNRLYVSTQDIFNELVKNYLLVPANEIIGYGVRVESRTSFHKEMRVVEYTINQ